MLTNLLNKVAISWWAGLTERLNERNGDGGEQRPWVPTTAPGLPVLVLFLSPWRSRVLSFLAETIEGVGGAEPPPPGFRNGSLRSQRGSARGGNVVALVNEERLRGNRYPLLTQAACAALDLSERGTDLSTRAEEIIVVNQAVGTRAGLLATGSAAGIVGDELERKPKKFQDAHRGVSAAGMKTLVAALVP